MAPKFPRLTTSGAALLGAVAGAVIATYGVVYVENSERNREEERTEEAAQGAALLLVDEFRQAGLYFERSLQNDVLARVPPDALIEVSDADRRLMAANLDPDAFGRATESANTANNVLRRLRARGRGRPYYARLVPPEGALMVLAINDMTEGREALRPLTGETPALRPPPPLRRKQPPIPPQPVLPRGEP